VYLHYHVRSNALFPLYSRCLFVACVLELAVCIAMCICSSDLYVANWAAPASVTFVRNILETWLKAKAFNPNPLKNAIKYLQSVRAPAPHVPVPPASSAIAASQDQSKHAASSNRPVRSSARCALLHVILTTYLRCHAPCVSHNFCVCATCLCNISVMQSIMRSVIEV
jgi:hypothetical protein